MNKANKIAKGEYILFLNSGDFFSNENVVSQIFTNLKGEFYSLIAGRTKIYYEEHDLGIVSPSKNIILDKQSESFSHQATFINKSIYKKLSYNTVFSISADKEYWYRVKLEENFSVKFYDLNISSFKLGGVSNNHKNILNRRLEDMFIDYIHKGINYRKFLKVFLLIFITYLLTINEKFYYRKIYVLKNKLTKS